MAEKSSHSFVASDMDLQVFRRSQLYFESSNYIVQDILGKGAFTTVARCIRIKPLERRKRPYAQISQKNNRSSDSTSPERKRRKICRGRSVVKRPYGEISQGSQRIPDISSPERKRRRRTMDTEEKNIELPSTSKDAPCTVAEVISMIRKEVASSGTRNPDTTSPPKNRKEDWKVTERVSKIWIIGDSYVRRGEEAADKRFGKNFGLNAEVQWFGKGGMRWCGVLPRFYAELDTQSPPDILVLHAGGNDLGLMPSKQLAYVMQRDLMQLRAEFPSMKIVFSCINERQVWRTGRPGMVNNDRKIVNRCIRNNLVNLGGEVIEHPLLKYYDKKIFLPDRVHFTKKGNQVFLTSIHCTLKKVLQRSSPKQCA